ncbi:TRAP transporter large permease subunit [Desulfoplanes sp. PS50]
MTHEDILVIAMMTTFIGLLFTGFPIALILGGVSILFAGIGYVSDLYFDTMTGLDFMSIGMEVNRIFAIMNNWIMVALPMFIFMGLMLDRSGIAENMMQSIQVLFGRVRGGLAITVTLIGIILAASTGIIGASVVGPFRTFIHACNAQPGIFQIPGLRHHLRGRHISRLHLVRHGHANGSQRHRGSYRGRTKTTICNA